MNEIYLRAWRRWLPEWVNRVIRRIERRRQLRRFVNDLPEWMR